jgi:hypothetical protein
LKGVLHVPDIVCNILGGVRGQGYGISDNKFVDLSTGETVAHLAREHSMWVIALSEFPYGPEVGPSPFEANVGYSISAIWLQTEGLKFEALKESQSALQNQQITSKSLTSYEKAWLEKNWASRPRAKHLQRRESKKTSHEPPVLMSDNDG